MSNIKAPRLKNSRGSAPPTAEKQEDEKDEKEAIIDTKLDENSYEAKLKALESYMSMYKVIQKENRELRSEIRKKDETHMKLTASLQADVELKNKTIFSFQKQLQEEKDRLAELKKQKSAEAEIIEASYKSQINELQENNARLSRQTADLDKAKRTKQTLQETLAQKDVEMKMIRENFAEELNNVKQQFVFEKQKQKKEEEQLKQRLEDEIHERAMELLPRKSQDIYQQNKEIEQQLLGFQKDVANLEQLKEKLVVENKKLKTEHLLAGTNIQDYAKDNLMLSKDIKEMKQKQKSLEETIAHIAASQKEEKKLILTEFENQEKNWQAEITKLENNLLVRTRELLHLKKIAETILSQRTELEMYFTESLGQVKAEKAKREEILANSELPTLTQRTPTKNVPGYLKGTLGGVSTYRTNHPPPQAPATPPFLTWEEKEQVLKLLFAKINGYRVTPQPQKPQSITVTNPFLPPVIPDNIKNKQTQERYKSMMASSKFASAKPIIKPQKKVPEPFLPPVAFDQEEIELENEQSNAFITNMNPDELEEELEEEEEEDT